MDSTSATPVFAGLRVLLISVNLLPDDGTRAALEAHGALVHATSDGPPPGRFDVAVTALVSPSRIGRHLPRDRTNAGLSVVGLGYVAACLEQGKQLPFGDHEIHVPADLRPAIEPIKESNDHVNGSPEKPGRQRATMASLMAAAAERRRKAGLEDAEAKKNAGIEVATTAEESIHVSTGVIPPKPTHDDKRLRTGPATFLPKSDHKQADRREREAASDDESESSDNNTVSKQKAIPGELASNFRNTKYSCMHPTPRVSPNDAICEALEVLAEVRELTGNEMNALAYRRAVSAVRSYPLQIKSPGEARKIAAIGQKIATKIDEFITTGRIGEAEKHRRSELFKVTRTFKGVYGVGPKKALEWYNKGWRSIEDVRKYASNLTSQQQLGIKYWNDLSQRIPRSEVDALVALVNKAAREINPEIISTTVGGYRRGKPDSGDIDILLAAPTEGGHRGLLQALVQKLKKSGFIVELMSYYEHTPPDKAKLYEMSAKEAMGLDSLDKAYTIVKSPVSGLCRQIDIVVAVGMKPRMILDQIADTLSIKPIEVYGPAVVGWTGSTMFERSIREFATKERGIQFQSWGIFKKHNGERIDCRDEKDVFKILELPYIPPEMRCG